MFLGHSPKAMEIKAKIKGQNQTYKLLHSKGNYNQNKTQPMKWEKICANGETDKDLISKIYWVGQKVRNILQKNPSKLFGQPNTNSSHNSTTKSPIKKWAAELNRHFSKEDVQMANRHVKNRSMAVITREMQSKTTMRYHLTLVRMAIIKKFTHNKRWRVWRKGNLPTLLVGM